MPTKDNRMPSDETDAKREEMHAGDALLEKENVTNATREHTMSHVVRHIR